jgi:hypothetical protein
MAMMTSPPNRTENSAPIDVAIQVGHLSVYHRMIPAENSIMTRSSITNGVHARILPMQLGCLQPSNANWSIVAEVIAVTEVIVALISNLPAICERTPASSAWSTPKTMAIIDMTPNKAAKVLKSS